MALYSENHNQITGALIWGSRLVTEPADSLSVAVRNAGWNCNAYRDRLFDRTFSITFLTPLWNTSYPLTRMTRTLEHPGHDAHVLHVIQHACPAARRTRNQTFETRSDGCDFHVFGHARVHLFERQVDDVLVIAADAARSTSSAAKHLLEDVTHVRPRPRAGSTRSAIITKLVVARSGIGVTQCFVRLVNLFKLFGVATFVGMIYASECPVRLFDLIYRGSLRNTERFVMTHAYVKLNVFIQVI
jgi:hypothetical protein